MPEELKPLHEVILRHIETGTDALASDVRDHRVDSAGARVIELCLCARMLEEGVVPTRYLEEAVTRLVRMRERIKTLATQDRGVAQVNLFLGVLVTDLRSRLQLATVSGVDALGEDSTLERAPTADGDGAVGD